MHPAYRTTADHDRRLRIGDDPDQVTAESDQHSPGGPPAKLQAEAKSGQHDNRSNLEGEPLPWLEVMRSHLSKERANRMTRAIGHPVYFQDERPSGSWVISNPGLASWSIAVCTQDAGRSG